MHTQTKQAADLESTIQQLEVKKGEFIERLDIGGAKIEEARSQGKDVSQWERFWVDLLHEYEKVCDKQRELSYQLTELQPA